jgi:hypothetical protein
MPVKKSKSPTTHKKTTHQQEGKPVRKSYKKSKKTQTGGGFKKSKNTTTQQPKKSKKQTGGKLNAYFKLMLDAKKKDLPSFSYNGKTYKQITAKTGLKMYKKV